jgi:hypothetical protein
VIYLCVRLELSLTSLFPFFSLLDVADSHPLHSDHQNLLYWKEPHKISKRVAREVLRLSEYNIEIRHIKGTSNGRADALSRRPDYDQGMEDNTNVVILPDHIFARTTATITQQHRQDEERLKPWVDSHHLKCLHSVCVTF